MSPTEKLRQIHENLSLALGLVELVEQKQMSGRVTVPLSLSVLTMIEIETKNAADALAQINKNIK